MVTVVMNETQKHHNDADGACPSLYEKMFCSPTVQTCLVEDYCHTQQADGAILSAYTVQHTASSRFHRDA